MTTLLIGLDPGAVSGAYGVLTRDGRYVACGDLPTTPLGRAGRLQVSPPLLAALLRALGPPDTLAAVVEAAQPMPRQGVSSSYRYGTAYGILLGVLGALGIPYTTVAPARWKRAVGLGPHKDAARTRALQRWPAAAAQLTRQRDHGRAEALLLAAYGLEQGVSL